MPAADTLCVVLHPVHEPDLTAASMTHLCCSTAVLAREDERIAAVTAPARQQLISSVGTAAGSAIRTSGDAIGCCYILDGPHPACSCASSIGLVPPPSSGPSARRFCRNDFLSFSLRARFEFFRGCPMIAPTSSRRVLADGSGCRHCVLLTRLSPPFTTQALPACSAPGCFKQTIQSHAHATHVVSL